MSRTRTAAVAGLLATSLLLSVGGLSAAAAGKIKAKQIAKNAILAKHIKTGAVGSDELAPGAVTGTKIAPGAVSGAAIAPNSVTGAHVDESTLGRVPDAAALGGATVTVVSRRLLSTNGAAVVIATGPGWTLGLDCSTTNALVQLDKTGTSSLVWTSMVVDGVLPQLTAEAFDQSQLVGDPTAFDYELTSVGTGTATTVVELSGARYPNALGGSEDCFFRGTVTTTP